MITSILRMTAGLALALFVAGTPALAQDFSDTQKSLDRRLSSSLEELARTRAQIAKEKVPLSRQVSKLENEVLELRQEQRQLLKLRDARTIDLTSLRRQVESMAEQDDFVNSRLNEFVRDFEGRLHISELATYEERTGAAKLAEKNVNLDAAGKRNTQLEVVSAALDRLEAQLGGQVFAGEALGPDGVLTEGRFVALGPTVFYASNDGALTGLVESRLNAADPVVVTMPPEYQAGLVTLAAESRGPLPFDATLGKALKIEKASKSVGQYISEGGYVGYVIVVLGLAALLLTLFKAAEILRFPVPEPTLVDDILDDIGMGDQAGAFQRAALIPGVGGELLTTGVEHVTEKRGVLEELLFERILRVRPTLERFLPFLAITAAAAPLLGLLGTVIGMIRTFQLITIFGTGDAKSLSSGISEALITTALGLIVAIPTLVTHGALSRMAKRKIGMLEEIALAFVNGVSTKERRAEAKRKKLALAQTGLE